MSVVNCDWCVFGDECVNSSGDVLSCSDYFKDDAKVIKSGKSNVGGVLKPSHYNQNGGGLDLLDACSGGLWDNRKFKGFLELNIVKYVLRYESKGGLEDLCKARRYLDVLIEEVEGE